MKKMRILSLAFSSLLTISVLGTSIAAAAPLQGITHVQISPNDTVNHNHGSSMVELPDGTLFAVWFSGDGERDGNKTKLVGARSNDGGATWTQPFTVYDTHDFPDNNPVIYVDSQKRLWLFYNVIYTGQWVSAQTKYMYADLGKYEYATRNGGNPKWHYPQPIYTNVGDGMVGRGSYSSGQWNYRIKGAEIKHVTPSSVMTNSPLDPSQYVEVTSWFNPNDKRYITDSFVVQMKRKYEQFIAYLQGEKPYDDVYTGRTDEIINSLQNGVYTFNGSTYTKYEPPIIKNSIERAAGADNNSDAWGVMYRRLGWQTKNKPIEVTLPSNKTRLILPLYSDSLANSICVYTDDNGITWKMSDPIVGAGTIQGSLIQLKDGTLRAYFRSGKLDGKNGRLAWHTTYSESTDHGASWSVAKVDPYLKNDGGFEISKLPNGDWLAATNQEVKRGEVAKMQDGHRSTFSLLLSKDEGKTWKSIMIKSDPTFKDSYQYPSVIVDHAGNALMNYSYFQSVAGGQNKVMGFAKVQSNEIEPLFESVTTATYGNSNPILVDSQTLLPTINVPVGTSEQLEFKVTVDGKELNAADGGLTWSSDLSANATIDGNGRVTAVKVGTALITVVSSKFGTIYKCIVNVTP